MRFRSLPTRIGAGAPLVSLMLLLGLPAAGHTQEAGLLLYTDGEAQLVRNLQSLPIERPMELAEDDTLRARIGARLKATLADDTVLMLWDDAEIRLVRVEVRLAQGRRDIELELVGGNVRVIVPPLMTGTSRVLLRTPSARVHLGDGADAVVRHNQSGDYSEVIAFSGEPVVTHLFEDFPGDVTLEAQQTSIVTLDSPPSEPVFVDAESFEELNEQLWWTMPRPVPGWDRLFTEKLVEQGLASFSRARRKATRPLTPVWSSAEGLMDSAVPEPPGGRQPVPRSTLDVRFDIDFESLKEASQ